MTKITLYGHPDSGHANKVALALALAGIEHETVFVDIWAAPETRPAAFLAASPLAQVPALVVGEETMTQSGAILLEIASRWQVLGGESAAGMRRGAELLMWEANRIGMCLPQLIEARRPHGDSFPDGAVDWLAARYETDRDNFDRLLGDAAFFHGETPGIGDVAIWGYGQWLDKAGVAPSAAMAGWLDRMAALPRMRPRGDSWFPV